MIGIYKITNPKGKIYIGQSIDVDYRKTSYQYTRCKGQPKIYNSLKKYGWENHKFEIIEECLVDELDGREVHWKKYYLDQVNNDWNMVLFCEIHDPGTGGYLSERMKLKMRNSALGRKNTEHQKQQLSISLRSYYSNNPGSFKGKKHSEETKLKIQKPVCAYKNGLLVKEYFSLKKAGLDNNVDSGNIIKAMQRNGKCRGFEWKYKLNN